MRTHEECTYCKFDAPHTSVTPLERSSEDWDGDKAKAREQCPLLNFKVLEMQSQKMLQDRAQDTPQDTTCNTGDQQPDLVNGIKDLTLDSKLDVQHSIDMPAPPTEVPEEKGKGEDGTERQSMISTYKMTEQETQLQKQEEE